jgi:hypothetical protein
MIHALHQYCTQTLSNRLHFLHALYTHKLRYSTYIKSPYHIVALMGGRACGLCSLIKLALYFPVLRDKIISTL